MTVKTSGNRYYDRQGRPLADWRAATALHADKAYVRVAETTLADGTWISTVWLGLDHRWDDGPPLIFETMVFPSRDNLEEQAVRRYATEAEAIAGHAAVVAEWQSQREVTR